MLAGRWPAGNCSRPLVGYAAPVRPAARVRRDQRIDARIYGCFLILRLGRCPDERGNLLLRRFVPTPGHFTPDCRAPGERRHLLVAFALAALVVAALAVMLAVAR